MVFTGYVEISSTGGTDVIDITDECRKILRNVPCLNGVMIIFNPGSTGGLTTLEYEPNLIKDLKAALEIFAPSDKVYEHGKTWHDDNGSSHIRSSLMGASLTVPFTDKSLMLGTWQQIVFCDFDTRARKRRLIVQLIGE
ncbi:MAG: secondary thiamine-phosphate synthase enzyme YjbQ [Candidatus Omnitrophota bacterium]